MARNDIHFAALIMMTYQNKQGGIVLVLVLWAIVLLTVIAGALTVTRNTGIAMVSNVKSHRLGRAQVEAGFKFMMLNMGLRPDSPAAAYWPIDGKLHPWRFNGAVIWIGAVPEASRIDLNGAGRDLLQGLFGSVGVALPQAQQLAGAIIDWRDKDSARQLDGMEDPGYRAEGLPIGARDDKFQSVEELRQVFGVSLEIYRAVESSLTVESGQSTVNPIYATPQVLAALPGMTQLTIDSYINQRADALNNGVVVPMPAGVDSRFVRAGSISAFRIYADVTSSDGVVTRGEAIIRIDRLTPSGYEVIARNFSPTTMPDKAVDGAVY